MSGDELRDFERRVFPSASEVEFDAQGRMVLPSRLRAYASIQSEVTVVGVRDHFEIWDRATWQAYQDRLEASNTNVPF